MNSYKPWDFCRSINCNALIRTEQQREQLCKSCKAYQMHGYLREHGQIVEEGSPLLKELEQLRKTLEYLANQREIEFECLNCPAKESCSYVVGDCHQEIAYSALARVKAGDPHEPS